MESLFSGVLPKGATCCCDYGHDGCSTLQYSATKMCNPQSSHRKLDLDPAIFLSFSCKKLLTRTYCLPDQLCYWRLYQMVENGHFGAAN